MLRFQSGFDHAPRAFVRPAVHCACALDAPITARERDLAASRRLAAAPSALPPSAAAHDLLVAVSGGGVELRPSRDFEQTFSRLEAVMQPNQQQRVKPAHSPKKSPHPSFQAQQQKLRNAQRRIMKRLAGKR